MQPTLAFDKPWKTGYLLDHVRCAKDLTWVPQDYQLVIRTQGGQLTTCVWASLQELIQILTAYLDNMKCSGWCIPLCFVHTKRKQKANAMSLKWNRVDYI